MFDERNIVTAEWGRGAVLWLCCAVEAVMRAVVDPQADAVSIILHCVIELLLSNASNISVQYM